MPNKNGCLFRNCSHSPFHVGSTLDEGGRVIGCACEVRRMGVYFANTGININVVLILGCEVKSASKLQVDLSISGAPEA